MVGLAALALMLGGVGMAFAAPPEDYDRALSGLGSSSRSQILKSVDVLAALGDPRAISALRALSEKRLRVDAQGNLYEEEAGTGVLFGLPGGERADPVPEDLRTPRINNSVRRALRSAIAQLGLGSADREQRLKATESLRERPDSDAVPAMRVALERESDPEVELSLQLALARVDLESEDLERQLSAIALLGRSGNRAAEASLKQLLAQHEGGARQGDDQFDAALSDALAEIELRHSLIDLVGNLLYGLSLASILLLVALGLGITFGLMKVINMAHGEMLMLGAYTTYVVQLLFLEYLPNWSDAYMGAAIVSSLVVCGAVGMALERTIIRHLYGRPLETLLATWGISLLLIQTVRLIFGAQNVEVANPSWLSGGVEVFSGVVLPWSRIGIVFFAGATVTAVWFLLQRTPMGLYVRAVTQNREMAACMGIPTGRVDMWTFGLGSAIAGLGGVALSQIGNVGPEMGQSYIVDSFLVVVLGGVGKIAGTVTAALGIGIVNKLLEPVTGAVFGKILVLVFIILFIQRRPQGIFALSGRAAEV